MNMSVKEYVLVPRNVYTSLLEKTDRLEVIEKEQLNSNPINSSQTFEDNNVQDHVQIEGNGRTPHIPFEPPDISPGLTSSVSDVVTSNRGNTQVKKTKRQRTEPSEKHTQDIDKKKKKKRSVKPAAEFSDWVSY